MRRDFKMLHLLSLSARRAWIEIDAIAVQAANSSVALRKESVDRNSLLGYFLHNGRVALRKESVDRNANTPPKENQPNAVALRKESVDRNRRHEDGSLRLDVALRKESVDRNVWRGLGQRPRLGRSPQGERG